MITTLSWVYFLKLKFETIENFNKFKAFVFLSNDFDYFYDKNVIRLKTLAPYTPEQNGVAERKNRMVIEKARSSLKEKSQIIFCHDRLYTVNVAGIQEP